MGLQVYICKYTWGCKYTGATQVYNILKYTASEQVYMGLLKYTIYNTLKYTVYNTLQYTASEQGYMGLLKYI